MKKPYPYNWDVFVQGVMATLGVLGLTILLFVALENYVVSVAQAEVRRAIDTYAPVHWDIR
jgi:hypothetical protein